MATKTIQIDDINGTDEATHLSVIIRLNEVTKILDLNDKHWDELNDLLAPYIAAGRDYEPIAPAGKRKLSHDERNSLLSYFRNVKHQDVKRVSQEDIAEWEAYIAERDAELLRKSDERTQEHASAAAIDQAIAAGEATTDSEPAPTPARASRRKS